MKSCGSKLTWVTSGACWLAVGAIHAQEMGTVNTLRLSASTPLKSDSPQIKESNYAQENAIPERSPSVEAYSNDDIPPEIRQAVYPNRSATTVTVVAEEQVSKEPATNQDRPPVHVVPDLQRPFPVQHAVHLEAAPANRLPTNSDSAPRSTFDILNQPNPRTSQKAVDSTAANPTQPVAHIGATEFRFQERPAAPTPTPTLASLLEASNTATHGKELNVDGRLMTGGSPIQRDEQTVRQSTEGFQKKLQQIATSTCIVLFLGVGFILVAKRWMGRRTKISNGDRNKSTARDVAPRIHVIANLKLNAKSHLHLVEIGDQRVLVASDLNGINSVTPLNQPFTAALGAYDDEMVDETVTAPAGTYTPAARAYTEVAAAKPIQPVPHTTPPGKSNAEVEAEMKRQLSELLGGQAFSDVFYKNTRTVA